MFRDTDHQEGGPVVEFTSPDSELMTAFHPVPPNLLPVIVNINSVIEISDGDIQNLITKVCQ